MNTAISTAYGRLKYRSMKTGVTKETLDSEYFQNYAKTMIPMARYGKEGELDTAAIFLASPMSTYVNGLILPVDGGYTAM